MINNNKASKLITVILVSLLIICYLLGIIRIHPYKKVPNENISFIKSLGAGYNIGNSLDACDWSNMFSNTYGNNTDTLWGCPVITKDFIKLLSSQGFKTIRVPVTYMNHIDEEGNIDGEWLDHVAEVVDMVISENMYCIIDIHHDTGNDGWIKASMENYNKNNIRVKNMIFQLAYKFKDYDEHLILEGFNEMVDEKSRWSKVPLSSYKALNKWNQLFVDSVRETGSKNLERYLLINTYAAAVNKTMFYYFELPKDVTKNRIIVGVHNYSGPDNLTKSFAIIKRLNRRGYPVIIGEFGNTANTTYNRAEFVEQYCNLCSQNGCCPIWWDNGQDPFQYASTSFALFNRNTNEIYFPEIIDKLTKR